MLFWSLWKLLLFSQRGEAKDAGGDAGAGNAGAGGGSGDTGDKGGDNDSPPSWYSGAESLKQTDPEIWQSFEKGVQSGGYKNLSGLVKQAVSLEKKLGGALHMPDKNKPEEISQFKEKLIQAGVLPQPAKLPDSPDKYEVKLDSIPAPMRSEPTVKAVTEWAHKHQLTNEALNELMEIEAQRYSETVAPVLEADRKKAIDAFDAFAKGIGKEPKELEAYGGAWLSKNFSEADIQFLENTKIAWEGGEISLADHPVLLKFAARAGLDTGEEISVTQGVGTFADTEFEEFVKNLSDPKHADYQLWFKGDPQDPKRIRLQQKYEQLYRQKFGTGEAKL